MFYAVYFCKNVVGNQSFLHIYECPRPVSYTHLDVYKRQVQRALLGIRGGSIGSRLMDDRQPIDNSGKTLADKAKERGVVEGVWVSEIVENGSAAGADIKVD